MKYTHPDFVKYKHFMVVISAITPIKDHESDWYN